MVRPAGSSAEVSPCYSAKNLLTSINKHPTPYIDIDDNNKHSTTYRHTEVITNTDKDTNLEDPQKEKPHQEQQIPNTICEMDNNQENANHSVYTSETKTNYGHCFQNEDCE